MIARAVMIGGALSIVNAVPALAQEAVSQVAEGQEAPEGSPPGVGTSAAQEQTAVAATSLPGETAAQQLGEILVTARRRDERAQDIPIAMAVVGGETIVKTGTQNVAQLTQIQPSVNYYATNPRNAAINIRGLGAPLGLTNDGLEQGVGVYVDQVYYSRIGTAVLDFFDVQRVEVLRGPQGTLYGKNTTAGAINVSTNKPTFTPEAYAEATLGNLELLQVRGAISGPVSDKVAVRVAAGGTSRRGTIFNVTSDRWVNERKNYGFRSHILWKPTETFDLLLSGDYGRQNTEAGAQIYVREGATQRPLNRQFASLAAAFNYAPPSTDPYDRVTDLDAKLLAGQKTGGVSLKGDLDVGFGTLTSVTAWRIWNWYPSSDRDFIGIPITTVSANPSRHRQFTQEVRLSSTGDNKLDYLLGAFYFTQRFKTFGAQEQGPAASRWLLNPGNVPPGTPGCATPTANACNPSVLNGLRSDNDIGYKSTSAALFGQLTWNISEALRIQPGLRLNYDKKDGSYEAVVRTGAGSTTLNNDQRNTLPPQAYAEKLDEWNVAYDLAASYDITPDVLAYANYARSFKSVGINMNGLPLSGGMPVQSAATVRPEKLHQFEVGLKTQFFNRALTANLAAFWTSISDYQTTVTSSQSGGVVLSYLANADKVRVRGVEGELSYRPNKRFNAYANGTFTDGKYLKFQDAPCPPELSGGAIAQPGQTPSAPGTPGGISPSSCDISGQWLPAISRWAASYGFEYNQPSTLLGTAGEAYFGFDGQARTKFSSNPSRSVYMDVGGYSLENFRLGFRRADNSLDAFAWVRNAFDRKYLEVLAQQSSNTGLIVGQPGDPRTFGVTLRGRF